MNHSTQAISGKGFSLIETLVTLVILVVGILALETFYISVVDRQQTARERLIAVHLAEEVIEFWQKDASDRVPNIDGSCFLTTRAAAAAYPVSVTCTPPALPIAYTIWSNTTQAQAPLPTSPNQGGTPLVAPNPGNFTIRNMQPVIINTPATHNSVTPMLKVVRISWFHKGKALPPIVLTHISSLR